MTAKEHSEDLAKRREEAKALHINGVVVNTVNTVLKPTMTFRWRVVEYCIEKVLEQKWISETGYEEWREIDVVE